MIVRPPLTMKSIKTCEAGQLISFGDQADIGVYFPRSDRAGLIVSFTSFRTTLVRLDAYAEVENSLDHVLCFDDGWTLDIDMAALPAVQDARMTMNPGALVLTPDAWFITVVDGRGQLQGLCISNFEVGFAHSYPSWTAFTDWRVTLKSEGSETSRGLLRVSNGTGSKISANA